MRVLVFGLAAFFAVAPLPAQTMVGGSTVGVGGAASSPSGQRITASMSGVSGAASASGSGVTLGNPVISGQASPAAASPPAAAPPVGGGGGGGGGCAAGATGGGDLGLVFLSFFGLLSRRRRPAGLFSWRTDEVAV